MNRLRRNGCLRPGQQVRLLGVLACLFPAASSAAPPGVPITGGPFIATIPPLMPFATDPTINRSPPLVIHMFNFPADEAAKLMQSSSSAAVLNRVLGSGSVPTGTLLPNAGTTVASDIDATPSVRIEFISPAGIAANPGTIGTAGLLLNGGRFVATGAVEEGGKVFFRAGK